MPSFLSSFKQQMLLTEIIHPPSLSNTTSTCPVSLSLTSCLLVPILLLWLKFSLPTRHTLSEQ
eukprot:m.353467 g.353467  ORF g.353467 m.353467 type:complete len:63 (-) comp16767_c0_seq1:422-610(-)